MVKTPLTQENSFTQALNPILRKVVCQHVKFHVMKLLRFLISIYIKIYNKRTFDCCQITKIILLKIPTTF